jgi:glutamate racemase
LPARLPIGVFDSGVGGLTVLRALKAQLPGEDFLYLGDTARLPYGTKSAASVVRYSTQCAQALTSRGIKALVVACNTAASVALPALAEACPGLKVHGVVEPGAQAAVAASSNGSIAVLATEGTIAGGAYSRAIARLAPGARVTGIACPLFVALAEAGWVDGPVVELVAHRYLDGLATSADPTDTLLLGCTHFPVLAPALARVLGADISIIDSAATTALAVTEGLKATGRVRDLGRAGRVRFLATDAPERFARVGTIFYGEPIDPGAVELIDLGPAGASEPNEPPIAATYSTGRH